MNQLGATKILSEGSLIKRINHTLQIAARISTTRTCVPLPVDSLPPGRKGRIRNQPQYARTQINERHLDRKSVV